MLQPPLFGFGDGMTWATQPSPPATRMQLCPLSQPVPLAQAGTHTPWQRPLSQSAAAVQESPSLPSIGMVVEGDRASLPQVKPVGQGYEAVQFCVQMVPAVPLGMRH